MNIEDLKMKVANACNIGAEPSEDVFDIVCRAIDDLHAKGLLMVWNEDMSQAKNTHTYLVKTEIGLFEAYFSKGIWVAEDPRGGGCYILHHEPTAFMKLPKGDA